MFLTLVAACLPIVTGCRILGIPSDRYQDANWTVTPEAVGGCHPADSYGPLPPANCVPGWLARWRAQKDLPEAPNYPRYHPLPTRPMFAPSPFASEKAYYGAAAKEYGQLSKENSPNQPSSGELVKPTPIPEVRSTIKP